MSAPIDRLIAIMEKLRNPDGGCPWDLKQDFKSLAPHTLEEAYEVVEAIEQNDTEHLKEELGDLLLQIVFQAQIARERNLFSFDDLVTGIADKMVERHPHVFGNRQGVKTADDVLRNWEADKAAKRELKHTQSTNDNTPTQPQKRQVSVLDGLTTALPALTRSYKIHKRAADAGFTWPEIDRVFEKLEEEVEELKVEIREEQERGVNNYERIEEEFGDVLSVIVNIARYLKIDPESALRRANRKFERRIHGMESLLAEQDRSLKDAPLAELEHLWQQVKRTENNH